MKETKIPQTDGPETLTGDGTGTPLAPVPRAGSASVSNPPPSKEVTAAAAAESRRARRDDLQEAAKLLGVDLGNSGDAIAQTIELERFDDTRRALALLGNRLKRAEDLLAKHIERLPRITAIND